MKSWKISILVLGDIISAYMGLFLMLLISFGSISQNDLGDHLLPFTIIFCFWIITLFVFDQYDPVKGRLKMYNLKRVGYAFVSALIVGVIVFYIGGFGITPKANLLLVFVFFCIFYIGWRRLVFITFKNNFIEYVTFLDSNIYVEELKIFITKNPELGYRLASESQKPDIVISEIPFTRNSRILSLGGAYENILGKIPLDIADKTLPYQIETKQESLAGIVLKRLFDIAFSFSILTLTSWLWPFIIMGIKLDDGGPIFYTHKRMGQYNRPFDFLKFRSMRIDAEKDGAVWAEKEDARVTRFGAFLRKSHLDELPQMINILSGDMSIIGPRPERPEFVIELEKEVPLYHLRHIIKPGFTGWAQIKYRYARTVLESKEKYEYDLYYIKNRNLALDLGILLRTIQIFVTHK